MTRPDLCAFRTRSMRADGTVIEFDDPRDAFTDPRPLEAFKRAIDRGLIEPVLDDAGEQVWVDGHDGPTRLYRSLVYREQPR